MDSKTYAKLKKRRRELTGKIAQNGETPELVAELEKIAKQLRDDPPTMEQAYGAL